LTVGTESVNLRPPYLRCGTGEGGRTGSERHAGAALNYRRDN